MRCQISAWGWAGEMCKKGKTGGASGKQVLGEGSRICRDLLEMAKTVSVSFLAKVKKFCFTYYKISQTYIFFIKFITFSTEILKLLHISPVFCIHLIVLQFWYLVGYTIFHPKNWCKISWHPFLVLKIFYVLLTSPYQTYVLLIHTLQKFPNLRYSVLLSHNWAFTSCLMRRAIGLFSFALMRCDC